ncbi:DMT family transporter [Paenibacillus lautus]|uniref:EamA family transporter n=1 Tax=Paenibacillus lautus TaxID=1401 RepID=UPI003D2B637F
MNEYIIIRLTGSLNFLKITGEAIVLMLVLGILHGGIGFIFLYRNERTKSQSIAVLNYIDPLTSLLNSGLIVGERMTLQQLFGAVLLLGSTWIGEGGGERKGLDESKNST